MWYSGEWMASCFEIFNFLKNAKKTCKPDNRDLNRYWNLLYSKYFTLHLAEGYSGPYQRSNIEFFLRIVNSFYFLIIFAKSSILDVWQGNIRVCPETMKIKKSYITLKNLMAALKQATWVLNHWKTLETSLTTNQMSGIKWLTCKASSSPPSNIFFD